MFKFIDKNFGKLFLIAVLIVGSIIAVKYFAPTRVGDSLGGSYTPSVISLAGSSSNLVSLPRLAVFANSTTTDAANTFAAGAQTGYLDGGQTITQSVSTGGMDQIRLNIEAKGGTSTSTMYIYPEFSVDNTNFFGIASSTDEASIDAVATTTLPALPLAFQWDPGKVTTTRSIILETTGANFTRFVLYAEDLLADPADGVQAWIDAIIIEPLSR